MPEYKFNKNSNCIFFGEFSERGHMPEYKFNKNSNCIFFGESLAYDSDVLSHFPIEARWRLAELHNHHPDWDYQDAEGALISEGLLPDNWRNN